MAAFWLLRESLRLAADSQPLIVAASLRRLACRHYASQLSARQQAVRRGFLRQLSLQPVFFGFHWIIFSLLAASLYYWYCHCIGPFSVTFAITPPLITLYFRLISLAATAPDYRHISDEAGCRLHARDWYWLPASSTLFIFFEMNDCWIFCWYFISLMIT